MIWLLNLPKILCYLIRACTKGPGAQVLLRVAEVLSQHLHELGNSGLLPHAEHAVVGPLWVIQVVALVTVERFF